MNLSTILRRCTKMYKSGLSYYLKSPPGRGKTTTVEGSADIIAAELNLNFGFVLINGPNLTPGDTIGFGIPKHTTREDGLVVDEMVFTRPFFARTSEGKLLEEYDGGIIFIDEADKADIDIKKVIGEMALTGRCGSYQLPKGWVVWMAGNRQMDRSGSTKELDHLINRRIELEITDDVGSWEAWALRNNVHPSIIAFAVSNPQIVFPDTLPEKQGPFCTPRSIVATGKLLMALRDDDKDELPTDTDAVEFASGAIGHAAAAQLFATLRLEAELPDINTILTTPGMAKVPTKPDAQMLVCYKLASLTDDKNIEPIVKYVERLPADFAATYAKAVVTRKPMLGASKTVIEWAKRNSSLLTIINQLA